LFFACVAGGLLFHMFVTLAILMRTLGVSLDWTQ
jgi:hypothetical protein